MLGYHSEYDKPFQSYYSLISNVVDSTQTLIISFDFNPIIVLFLTFTIHDNAPPSNRFQSYYSLISNSVNMNYKKEKLNFNPIIVLFLT